MEGNFGIFLNLNIIFQFIPYVVNQPKYKIKIIKIVKSYTIHLILFLPSFKPNDVR